MPSSLHNHSDMSFQDGFAKPREYFELAQKLGYKALAITEHGNLCSAPYIDLLSKEFPDIKVIYGFEAYECFDINVQDKNNKYFHLIVLAKNENGRKAINKIITRSNFEGFYFKPRVDLNMLKPFAKDLIITTACLASKLAREQDYKKCIEYINEYKNIFPYFYLEMQSHQHIDQELYNQKILQLSKDTNTKYIITTDSHAATQEDLYYQARHVQVAQDADTMNEIYEGCYMQSFEEIHNIMDSQIGYDAVECGLQTTDEIAELVEEVHMPFQDPQLPDFPLPKGFETDYEYLKYLVEKGWEKRQIDNLSPEDIKAHRDRLDYELGIIHQMKYDGYFLIVWDFISYAKTHGIIVGDGRGSAGGSMVCYLLEISALDPLKYNLIFERFLNPERISMPDIDVDFADRDKIVDYLISRYGEDRVCQIMNFSEITPVVAIKDVARVLKIPYNVADKIAKKFTYSTFRECMENNPSILVDYPQYEELFDIAGHLSGRYRFTGMHAGGVGIVNTSVSDYMPMKLGSHGEHVIQVDKKMAAKIGIVKFDILGVATLEVIQEVKDDANISDWELDPNNDEFLSNKKMYDLLCSAKTNGVFQVESAGMKELLYRLHPTDLNDISAVLALYRPDSMSMLDDYIYYKNHQDQIQYLHPDMKQILAETYGTIIFQEEIMDITRIFGGRSYGGADKFRKGIGSKDTKLIQNETKKLYDEILSNGYDKTIADSICKQMEKYGKYSFNKSHSILYGVICLRTAYLKANYTSYFFKALFNKNKDKAGMLNKYILDAKDFGVKVLPPNINKSEVNFSTDGQNVLFGLSAISKIGESLAQIIVCERIKNGKFTSFQNLLRRVPLNRSQVIQLIKAGAIPTKNKRKTLIQYLKSMYQPTTFKPVAKAPSYKQLLIKWDIDAEDYRIGEKKYDYDKDAILKAYNDKKYELYKDKEKERFQKFITQNQKYLENEDFWEFEALQIFINDNPFDQAYKYMSKQFQDVENGDDCTVVAVIAKVDKKKDKNKKTFAYVNLYSSFGLTEAIVWHSQLKEYEDMIVKGNQIAMLCRKDSDEKVIAKKIKPYKQWLEDIKKVKGVVA